MLELQVARLTTDLAIHSTQTSMPSSNVTLDLSRISQPALHTHTQRYGLSIGAKFLLSWDFIIHSYGPCVSECAILSKEQCFDLISVCIHCTTLLNLLYISFQ